MIEKILLPIIKFFFPFSHLYKFIIIGFNRRCKDIWLPLRCHRKKERGNCGITKVSKNCKRTCGYCPGYNDSCKDIWLRKRCRRKKFKGNCNIKKVSRNCQKTCGHCPGKVIVIHELSWIGTNIILNVVIIKRIFSESL